MRPEPGRTARLGEPPLATPPLVRGDDAQSDLAIDLERWERLATDALAAEGAAPGTELSLVFVDEAAMAELRSTHLGETGPTDVLSFPIDDEPGSEPAVPRLLGDVAICPVVAARNAPDHAGSTDDEIALLVVHGVLHVLGCDHAVARDRDEMWARERALLDRFHGPLGRDPWTDQEDATDG